MLELGGRCTGCCPVQKVGQNVPRGTGDDGVLASKTSGAHGFSVVKGGYYERRHN